MWVVLGVALGVILLSIARTVYYLWVELKPEMSPMMFIIFSPVLAIFFSIIAIIIESIISVIWPRSLFSQPITIGASYSSVLLGLIHPWLLIICLIINPFVLHFVMARSIKASE